jgi:CIC family chloride channel protein
MYPALLAAMVRIRLLSTKALSRLGFGEHAFLLLLAVLIGVVAAAAAVGFHELIRGIRDLLYAHLGPRMGIYHRGIWILVLLPALGGLAVGLITRYVFLIREGHGIVDVIESVIRSSGIIRPLSAIEKIITSAITIGSGGSAGAEGPIVQIGAGIASGVGQLFGVARSSMPLLIGCGSAAGIIAIFDSPIGGVFFTLEVILLDFSLRTFAPVVLASVIANVMTKEIFLWRHQNYEAIFALPPWAISNQAELGWTHLPNFILLGMVCGVVGVALTRMMNFTENRFERMSIAQPWRPAIGGALLGVMAVIYVMIFGWWMAGRQKPVEFGAYPLPAFFSDGYGVIRQLVSTGGAGGAGSTLYQQYDAKMLMVLLAALVLFKILGTCATLGSGGSGGIIAPSLFLGATAGGLVGLFLRQIGAHVEPSVYSMCGMAAVLAAVVHAPLASVLILLDLTGDQKLILPGMLATIVATGIARSIFRDSIYSASLRERGVKMGTAKDLSILRRLTVEAVELEPATCVGPKDSLEKVLELTERLGVGDFIVIEENGIYVGFVSGEDVKVALLQREAVPLLTVRDVMRAEVMPVNTIDDLAGVLEIFSRHDVDHLPVRVSKSSGKIVGMISRAKLLRRYQRGLEST